MESMKILIITPYISVNGLGRVAANLSKIFSSNGHEVVLFCRYETDSYFSYSGTLVTYKHLNHRSKVDIFGYSLALKKYINSNVFDISISIGPSNDLLNVILNKKNTKKITSIHNNINKSYSFFYKTLFPYVAKKSDVIVPVSSALGEIAQRLINKKYKYKINHIVNPVCIENQDKLDINKAEEYFICVGRIEEQKALWHVISALHLCDSNHIVYILGDGSQLEILTELVIKNKLTENIKFLGFIKEPLQYVNSAKALLMTSIYEGLPMVLIESMMLGTPIISVDCETGPREIIAYDEINNAYPGVLLKNKASHWEEYRNNDFKSNLDVELSNVIDNLTSEDYRKMSLACKEVSKKFSFKSVGKEWELLFNVK